MRRPAPAFRRSTTRFNPAGLPGSPDGRIPAPPPPAYCRHGRGLLRAPSPGPFPHRNSLIRMAAGSPSREEPVPAAFQVHLVACRMGCFTSSTAVGARSTPSPWPGWPPGGAELGHNQLPGAAGISTSAPAEAVSASVAPRSRRGGGTRLKGPLPAGWAHVAEEVQGVPGFSGRSPGGDRPARMASRCSRRRERVSRYIHPSRVGWRHSLLQFLRCERAEGLGDRPVRPGPPPAPGHGPGWFHDGLGRARGLFPDHPPQGAAVRGGGVGPEWRVGTPPAGVQGVPDHPRWTTAYPASGSRWSTASIVPGDIRHSPHVPWACPARLVPALRGVWEARVPALRHQPPEDHPRTGGRPPLQGSSSYMDASACKGRRVQRRWVWIVAIRMGGLFRIGKRRVRPMGGRRLGGSAVRR